MSRFEQDAREWIEFRPRPSSGRNWVISIGAGALALFIVTAAIVSFAEGMPLPLTISILVLGLGVTAPIFTVAWHVPSMRYWVGPDELVLRFGPLMNDRIPLDEITSISRQEKLKISFLASFRFPGLAVFDVDYIDSGRIRMCATSASSGILIIDTEQRRYGITPADEPAFVSALQSRRTDQPIPVIELQSESSSG